MFEIGSGPMAVEREKADGRGKRERKRGEDDQQGGGGLAVGERSMAAMAHLGGPCRGSRSG